MAGARITNRTSKEYDLSYWTKGLAEGARHLHTLHVAPGATETLEMDDGEALGKLLAVQLVYGLRKADANAPPADLSYEMVA